MITNQTKEEAEITEALSQGELLIVNPRRKNGLILIKKYHAEFAGPGSVVGGCFDRNLRAVISVGNLSLTKGETTEDRHKGYLIRRQWVRLTKQITDNPIADERAQVILNQFEHWFDSETASNVPDQVFALLVGVLPQTITKARSLVDRL